jgi:hypothetical protein
MFKKNQSQRAKPQIFLPASAIIERREQIETDHRVLEYEQHLKEEANRALKENARVNIVKGGGIQIQRKQTQSELEKELKTRELLKSIDEENGVYVAPRVITQLEHTLDDLDEYSEDRQISGLVHNNVSKNFQVAAFHEEEIQLNDDRRFLKQDAREIEQPNPLLLKSNPFLESDQVESQQVENTDLHRSSKVLEKNTNQKVYYQTTENQDSSYVLTDAAKKKSTLQKQVISTRFAPTAASKEEIALAELLDGETASSHRQKSHFKNPTALGLFTTEKPEEEMEETTKETQKKNANVGYRTSYRPSFTDREETELSQVESSRIKKNQFLAKTHSNKTMAILMQNDKEELDTDLRNLQEERDECKSTKRNVQKTIVHTGRETDQTGETMEELYEKQIQLTKKPQNVTNVYEKKEHPIHTEQDLRTVQKNVTKGLLRTNFLTRIADKENDKTDFVSPEDRISKNTLSKDPRKELMTKAFIPNVSAQDQPIFVPKNKKDLLRTSEARAQHFETKAIQSIDDIALKFKESRIKKERNASENQPIQKELAIAEIEFQTSKKPYHDYILPQKKEETRTVIESDTSYGTAEELVETSQSKTRNLQNTRNPTESQCESFYDEVPAKARNPSKGILKQPKSVTILSPNTGNLFNTNDSPLVSKVQTSRTNNLAAQVTRKNLVQEYEEGGLLPLENLTETTTINVSPRTGKILQVVQDTSKSKLNMTSKTTPRISTRKTLNLVMEQ